MDRLFGLLQICGIQSKKLAGGGTSSDAAKGRKQVPDNDNDGDESKSADLPPRSRKGSATSTRGNSLRLQTASPTTTVEKEKTGKKPAARKKRKLETPVAESPVPDDTTKVRLKDECEQTPAGLISDSESRIVSTGSSSFPNGGASSNGNVSNSVSLCSKVTQKDSKRLSIVEQKQRRWDTFKLRSKWTFLLILGVTAAVITGHLYLSVMVIAITFRSYKEIVNLRRNEEKEKRAPYSIALSWYWFFVAMVAAVRDRLIPMYDALHIHKPRALLWAVNSYSLIVYAAGLLGLILFISSLRKSMLEAQFAQFALMVMTCAFVVGQSTFQVENIFAGLYWFVVPAALVAVNDTMAYVCGTLFGKHQLYRLSPSKTWEGFVGASILTLLASIPLAVVCSEIGFLVCPGKIDFVPGRHFLRGVSEHGMFSENWCQPPPVFVWKETELWSWLHNSVITKFMLQNSLANKWLVEGPDEAIRIRYKPIHLHTFVMAIFAAFIAPFGGFLASALKRMFRAKNFSETIPGHGGAMDRMDCQLLLGTFVAIWRIAICERVSKKLLDRLLQLSQPELRALLVDLKTTISDRNGSEDLSQLQGAFC